MYYKTEIKIAYVSNNNMNSIKMFITLIGLKMNSLIVPTCAHNKTNWHLKAPQHYTYKNVFFHTTEIVCKYRKA